VDPNTPGADSPWSPPDAGRPAPPPPPGGPRIETDATDGPPLPPPVRARRRRRRIILAALAAVVLIAIPVGLAIAGAGSWLTLGGAGDELAGDESGVDAGDDADGSDDRDGDGDGSDGSDGEGAPDGPIGQRPGVTPSLDAPDPAQLSGVDAVYADLLLEVDRSERVMIGFQDDLTDAFGSAGAGPDGDLAGTVRTIAAERRDELLDVRDGLLAEVDDDGADVVRERYLAHLDSWSDYMEAVAEDPEVLAGEGADGGFTVVINQTADAFARALDEQLPADADAEVQNFAEGILDRGFRSSGDAQV
jgi:hypothetical protein